MVLLGPFGDEGSEGRIGGEDAVVAVTVDAGWRQDRGEPIEELQGREAQRSASGGIGLGEEVEDLIGAATDEVEPFEGKGRPGTIADQPFQSVPVGGLDADAPIEAKPATVLPAQHILGLLGLQEAVADHVTEDPGADRVL